jgi:hypothetical protein
VGSQVKGLEAGDLGCDKVQRVANEGESSVNARGGGKDFVEVGDSRIGRRK